MSQKEWDALIRGASMEPLEMEDKKKFSTNHSDIPFNAIHMSVKDFVKACMKGKIKDGDGHGFYATSTKMTNIKVEPSIIVCVMDHKYSDVVWFPNE